MRGCHEPRVRGKTHYYWGAAFDVPDIPQDVADKTAANVVAAFNEDKDLLQKFKRMLPQTRVGSTLQNSTWAPTRPAFVSDNKKKLEAERNG